MSITKLVPVYDIVNCGPRHQFVANGKLVHNSDGLNLQNLPSGRDGRGARLREAIEAPKGYVIVVVDSAQIEPRVNACLWNQEDLLTIFRNKGDPYSDMASKLHHVPVGKKGPNSHLRPLGKALIIGLGYGMGQDRFLAGCLSGSITGDIIEITKDESINAVEFYRRDQNKIVEGWEVLRQVLAHMVSWNAEEKASGISIPFAGFLAAAPDRIIMPNGLSLHYKNLSYVYFEDKGKREMVYEVGRDSIGQPQYNRIWGSKLCENIVQSLARIIVGEQMIKIAKRYAILSSSHDEVIFLAKEKEAEEALEFGLAAMRVPPKWMPNIPLDAEGGWDRMYSK